MHAELGVLVPEAEALAEKHELATGWAEYADAMLQLQCDDEQRERALHSALDQARLLLCRYWQARDTEGSSWQSLLAGIGA